MRDCNDCPNFKAVCHILYKNLQLLLLLLLYKRDLLVDFVIGLTLSTDRKRKTLTQFLSLLTFDKNYILPTSHIYY